MFAAVSLWWKLLPDWVKTLLSEVIKWALLILALFLAGWYIMVTSYDAGHLAGVNEAEAKYKGAADAEKSKTIVQDRVVKQYISKRTDADLRNILQFWMLPDSEGADTSR